MLGKVLPAIGSTDESHRSFFPRSGGCERQSDAVVRSKEHRDALVVGSPAGVAVSAVCQVRRENGVEVIVRELTLQRLEANFLQNDVAVRVGEDFLVDAIESAGAGIGQLKGGDAGLE